MEATHQYVKVELKNNVQYIYINRPDKLNALNTTLLKEIGSVVNAAQTNEDVYGIVLTGAGEKAFAAGADIAEFANFTKEQGTSMSRDGHAVMNAIENSEKPVIAAVNGFALGGGCELAMACHMRIASENAKFGQPEVNLGVPPGYGGTQRLIAYIGKGKAIELLLTGEAIGAQEALSLGLVNKVVPQEELLPSCEALLHKIAKKSPAAVGKVIRCVNDYFNTAKNGMETEIMEFGNSFQTEEFQIGTTAFLNREKPNYRS